MKFMRTDAEQIREGACFVVMPFGKKVDANGSEFDWDEFYDDIIAGAAREAGMEPLRADDIYGPTPVIDNVWRGLKDAEIIIADLSGRSPNVLYELGLAHVLGKRVVLLIRDNEKVPIDLAGINHLLYSLNGTGAVRAKSELTKRIVAARTQAATEATIMPMASMVVEEVTAVVESISPEYATLRLPPARLAFLKAEDWDWTRKPQSLDKIPALAVGGHLQGFFYTLGNEPRFSPRHPRDNPWSHLEQEFPIGSEFTGTVFSVVPTLGVFVELKYRVNGLIHRMHVPSGAQIEKGMKVEARVKRVDPILREIQLEWIGVKGAASSAGAPEPNQVATFPFDVGHRLSGVIFRPVYDRGYVLVTVEGREKPVLLPQSKMTPECSQRFLDRELTIGCPIDVEVVQLNPSDDRVTVRDVSAAPDSGGERAARE